MFLLLQARYYNSTYFKPLMYCYYLYCHCLVKEKHVYLQRYKFFSNCSLQEVIMTIYATFYTPHLFDLWSE
jgi:hypothetical protein